MSPILAQTGYSLFGVQYLAMIAALAPVIAAEILVARRMLRLDATRAAVAVIPANLVSTVIGFPLVWLVLLVLQMPIAGGCARGLASPFSRAYAVNIRVPWLIPHGHDLNWMIPAASIYLLIPAFFASVFIERWICAVFWRDVSKARLRRYSWRAHFVSYAVLLATVALYFFVRAQTG